MTFYFKILKVIYAPKMEWSVNYFNHFGTECFVFLKWCVEYIFTNLSLFIFYIKKKYKYY